MPRAAFSLVVLLFGFGGSTLANATRETIAVKSRMLLVVGIACAAISGCGRASGTSQSGTPSEPAASADSSANSPIIGSPEWLKLVEKNAKDDEAQFKANAVRPGGTLAVGNVRISNIRATKAGDVIDVAMTIQNTSENKAFSPFCFVNKATDEHGNSMSVRQLHEITNDLSVISEAGGDIQPGESRTAHVYFVPKLKAAKRGTLQIATDQGDDIKSARWTLSLDLPQD